MVAPGHVWYAKSEFSTMRDVKAYVQALLCVNPWLVAL